MIDIKFRSYEPNDYLQVKQILEEGKLFVPTWDSEQRLRERIEGKQDSIIVATIGEEVVGNIYLIDDVLPFVFRLAVKKEYRKQGIGKMLLDEAVKTLKKHGHSEVAIFVDEENEGLKEWYRKQGFKDAGKWRCMWREI